MALLFALAIGEVGLQIPNLLNAPPYFAAFSHLLFTTVLIAASWVGWSTARASGAQHDATQVWSKNFVILLLDVAIVLIYFEMVHGLSNGVPGLARRDALGLTLVFACYVVWDLLVSNWRWSWSVISFTCLILSFATFWLLRGVKTDTGVALGDLSLLALALLFRAVAEQCRQGQDLTALRCLQQFSSGRSLVVLALFALLGTAARLVG